MFEAGGHALDEADLGSLRSGFRNEEHGHQDGRASPYFIWNFGRFVGPECLGMFGAG